MGQDHLEIVLAEDDTDLRMVLGNFLRAEGHRVHSVGSGVAAFEILLRTPIDLVISDVDMPEGTGIWLLGKLREIEHIVPLILISGGACEPVSAQLAGASAFLAKPFGLLLLKETIEGLELKSLTKPSKHRKLSHG